MSRKGFQVFTERNMLTSADNIASPQFQATAAFLTAFADPPWRITAGVTERAFAVKKLTEMARWIEAQQDLKRNVSVALPAAGKRVWHLAVRVPSNRPIRCKLPSSLAITADCYWLLWRLNEAVDIQTAKKLSEQLAKEIGEGAVSAIGEAVPMPGTVRFAQGGGLARNANVYLVRSLPTAYRIVDGELADVRPNTGGSVFRRADLVEEVPVQWLWPNMIPLGDLTVLMGGMGMGKTTIALDIAARVTSGAAFPGSGDVRKQASVLIVETEDKAEKAVVARLRAAGTDMRKVMLHDEAFDLSKGVEMLEAEAKRVVDLRLVVLSPVRMFFGVPEAHGPVEMRSRLKPLLRWADERNVAVIGIAHMIPGTKGKRAEDMAGPKALAEASRSALSAVVDMSDDEPDLRLKRRKLVGVRVSAGPDGQGWPYRIIPAGESSRIKWL